MATVKEFDLAVIGGGVTGAAIAYGLASRGLAVALFDGSDRDARAARANYGIIWVQGKGLTMPAYQHLTRRSSDAWPSFAVDLEKLTGINLRYERNGGIHFCLGSNDFARRAAELDGLHALAGAAESDFEMVDRARLERMLPKVLLGPEVTGASYCWRDAHVNPLLLLRAFHAAFGILGGTLFSDRAIISIKPRRDEFELSWGEGALRVPKIVIAAGNGTAALAAMVGLEIPLRPQRGQILVTERLVPMMPLPGTPIRQTADGTILIGSTQEEVGFDQTTSVEAGARMAGRAVRIMPRLADAIVVRQWAGLRVMTPDSHPVYAESVTNPGAFVTLCHSGVTLAAAHATELAGVLADGSLSADLAPFHHGRFDVSQAA